MAAVPFRGGHYAVRGDHYLLHASTLNYLSRYYDFKTVVLF